MKNYIALCLSLFLGYSTFCQTQDIQTDGHVIVGNNSNSTPIAGAIRWTGSDFEGYNGTAWVSLTCCNSAPPDGGEDCYDPWVDNGSNLENRVSRLLNDNPYRTGFGANATGGTSRLVVVNNLAATGTGTYADIIDKAKAGDYIIFDPSHTVYQNGCIGLGCDVPGSVTIDGSLPTGQNVTLRKNESTTYYRSLSFKGGNNIVTNLLIDHNTKATAVAVGNGENYWFDAIRVIALQDDAFGIGSPNLDPENSADNVTVSRYQVFSDSGKGLLILAGGMSCKNNPNLIGSDIAINQRRAHVTIIDSELAAKTRNIMNNGGYADIIGCYIYGQSENSISRHGAQTIIRCSYIDSRTVITRAIRADEGIYTTGENAANASYCPEDVEVFLDNNLYRQVNFTAESADPRINQSGSDIDTGAGGHMTNGIANWANPPTGRPVFPRPYEADIIKFCNSPEAASNAGPAFVLEEICKP